MKIFNGGLNRAGTTSLTHALRQLGFRTAHFKHDGDRLYNLIVRNIRRRRRLLTGLEEHYDAFSDFAGHNFVPQLDHQYPGSRFILTVRELESWLDSRERKVRRNQADENYRYAFRTVDREKWAAERARYVDALCKYFRDRPGDLLVIDIPAGEGWEKLCPFLGVAIPAAPFPFENRLAEPAGESSASE